MHYSDVILQTFCVSWEVCEIEGFGEIYWIIENLWDFKNFYENFYEKILCKILWFLGMMWILWNFCGFPRIVQPWTPHLSYFPQHISRLMPLPFPCGFLPAFLTFLTFLTIFSHFFTFFTFVIFPEWSRACIFVHLESESF